MAKRIVILGAGESGAGAAVLAKKQGFDTFVSDMSTIKGHIQKHAERARHRMGRRQTYRISHSECG